GLGRSFGFACAHALHRFDIATRHGLIHVVAGRRDARGGLGLPMHRHVASSYSIHASSSSSSVSSWRIRIKNNAAVTAIKAPSAGQSAPHICEGKVPTTSVVGWVVFQIFTA